MGAALRVSRIAGCHRRDSSLYGGSGWRLRGCRYQRRLRYLAARLKTKTSDSLGYAETYERCLGKSLLRLPIEKRIYHVT
jgi:hypothetical protein